MSLSWLLAALIGLQTASAQFPPKPEGATVLRSKVHENVTLSFKEVGTQSRVVVVVTICVTTSLT